MNVSPSILGCNFLTLQDEIESVAPYSDWLHMDVMDGHFVPNISFGPDFVKWTRSATTLPIESHLMISQPERLLSMFIDAGSTLITVHIEATDELPAIIQTLKEQNRTIGIALNPDTPVDHIEKYLASIDHVLIMSVYPGFCGQSFIEDSLHRVRLLSALRDQSKNKFTIGIDGGVSTANADKIRVAGVDIAVVGSALFSQNDRKSIIQTIRGENTL